MRIMYDKCVILLIIILSAYSPLFHSLFLFHYLYQSPVIYVFLFLIKYLVCYSFINDNDVTMMYKNSVGNPVSLNQI